MAGNVIIGSLNPNGRLSATPGQEFIDINERIRYRQQTVPYGNNWQIIERNVDVSLTGNTPTTTSWGAITGTLSNQTDLQSALDAKQSLLPNGTASNQYLNWTGTQYSPKQISFSELSGSITLTGDVSGSGSTSITTSISDTTVNGKLLTGYSVGSSTAIAATDSIVSAFGKVQAQINTNTSAISGLSSVYYPLTGGDLSSTTNGYVGLPAISIPSAPSGSTIRLYSSSGSLAWRKSGASITRVLADAATSSRTWTLPDATGTIPVISGTMAANQVAVWSSTNQETSYSTFTYNGTKAALTGSAEILDITTTSSTGKQAYISFYHSTSTEQYRWGLNPNGTNSNNAGFGLYDAVNLLNIITFNYKGQQRLGIFTTTPNLSYGTTISSPLGVINSNAAFSSGYAAEFINTQGVGGRTTTVSFGLAPSNANTAYAMKIACTDTIFVTSWIGTRLTIGGVAPSNGRVFNITSGVGNDNNNSAWGLNGRCIVVDSDTYLDSTSAASSIVASTAIHTINIPSIKNTNTNVTYSEVATWYIAGAPTIAAGSGTGTVITDGYGLWNAGRTRLDSSLALFGAPSFGGGSKVVYIANAAVTPTSTPSGGGILYVDSGALKYIGSSGTPTTIAPA